MDSYENKQDGFGTPRTYIRHGIGGIYFHFGPNHISFCTCSSCNSIDKRPHDSYGEMTYEQAEVLALELLAHAKRRKLEHKQ